MPATQPDGSILEASILFAGFDRGALDELARGARIVTLTPGQTLFHQGDETDGCYIVLEGVLKVSIVDGHGHDEAVLALLGPGETIGEMGLIDNRPRSASATALKPSRLAFIATDAFMRFAQAQPDIHRHMLAILIERLRKTNASFTEHLLLPVEARVARGLWRLADVFGHPLDGGRVLVRQKVTQRDLARLAASNRESVNRLLGGWRKNGIVSRISLYYCIEDSDALRDIARF